MRRQPGARREGGGVQRVVGCTQASPYHQGERAVEPGPLASSVVTCLGSGRPACPRIGPPDFPPFDRSQGTSPDDALAFRQAPTIEGCFGTASQKHYKEVEHNGHAIKVRWAGTWGEVGVRWRVGAWGRSMRRRALSRDPS